MSKNNKKKQINQIQEDKFDLFKDYEPDGRDLAEHLSSEEQWKEENPDVKPEDLADHYAELQGEIKRGK